MTVKFNVILSKEDNWYIAKCIENNVVSQGKTIEETMSNLQEAIGLYYETKTKNYHVNVFYSEDDEGYIADIPDLKNCSAFGETQQEALSEVLIAQKLWLEEAEPDEFDLKLINEIEEDDVLLSFDDAVKDIGFNKE